MILYYEFATQLQDADINILLKLINNMMTSDKLMGYVNGCKVRQKRSYIEIARKNVMFFFLRSLLCQV